MTNIEQLLEALRDILRSQNNYYNGFAITPSDTNEIGQHVDAFRVASAGNVVVVMKGGYEMTINADTENIYPYSIKQVKATGTTATGITGLIAQR